LKSFFLIKYVFISSVFFSLSSNTYIYNDSISWRSIPSLSIWLLNLSHQVNMKSALLYNHLGGNSFGLKICFLCDFMFKSCGYLYDSYWRFI
jgi:hypothetical protein